MCFCSFLGKMLRKDALGFYQGLNIFTSIKENTIVWQHVPKCLDKGTWISPTLTPLWPFWLLQSVKEDILKHFKKPIYFIFYWNLPFDFNAFLNKTMIIEKKVLNNTLCHISFIYFCKIEHIYYFKQWQP